MEMPGYKTFQVMHSGKFFFPESELTPEYFVSDDKNKVWAEVYRIGQHEGEWMIYYGEDVLGYTYIRFAHTKDMAVAIADAWIDDHEV